MTTPYRFRLSAVAAAISFSVFSVVGDSAYAQRAAEGLDEILVTAQRREQSLQEVPISIEAFTGDSIQQQGFRDMVDLTDFSTAARIEPNQDRINITIRGIGTAGNNQALEQSVPTFVDGIHFGRSGQILGAFLDVERVEILRGPQPIFFGQNANAGAFSIITRKPTDEWQGQVRAEVGNHGKQAFEFGVGGPLSDTFGIRVAGKYDYSSGYLKDILTGRSFPEYDLFTGRAILQWTPTDSFRATAKFQFAQQETDGDGEAVQRSIGSSMNPIPIDRYGLQTLIQGMPNASFHPIPNDFGAGWGIMPGSTYLNPSYSGVPWLSESDRTSIDLSGFLPEYLRNNPNAYGKRGPDSIAAHDNLDPWDAYLDLSYVFDNGLEISSLSGFSHYVRENAEDNSSNYFLANWTFRSEYLDQWSQELRIASPEGGALEWMAGLYFQKNELDMKTVSFRANIRRPARNPVALEEAEWKSAFAAVTWNITDVLALDLGARYTDVEKRGRQWQFAQEWIFDDGTPDGVALGEIPHGRFLSDPFYSQFVGATPIGITPEHPSDADGVAENDATFKDQRLDPQVVLRYNLTDDLSFYAKYAEAFKAGGFEIELKSTPVPENFVFGNEYTTNYEVGAKGTFWDGRARGSLTLFHTEVDDLQIGTSLPLAVTNAIGANSKTVNAGRMRVRGVELDLSALVTEQLTVGFSAAVYDGIMASFENAGCTEAEVATGQCEDMEEFTKDRTGEDAPRLPDWVVIANAAYERPIFGDYRLTLDGNFKYSDGYLTNIETFSRVVQMPRHTDLNLSIGFGDQDGTWLLSVFGRHLTEPRKQYYPEYDVDPEALVTASLPRSAFAAYGVQFRYWYN